MREYIMGAIPQMPAIDKMADSLVRCLSAAVENVHAGVIAVDLSGDIVLFNKAAEDITGYAQDDIVGMKFSDVPFVCESFNGYGDLVRLTDAGLDGGIRDEVRISRKDGIVIDVETSICPVTDDSGTVLGAVNIFSDMTAINRLKNEVSRSRTLSALGEMSANVAHEIRNPLGGIGGFAALLERDLDDDDPRRNLVKKIIEGVASLDKIVTNLLIYTRPITPDLRMIELNMFLEEVLSFLEVELENRSETISIVRKYPEQSLRTKIDPSLMQQVMLNILHNAVYAMRNTEGRLEVTLAMKDKVDSGDNVDLKNYPVGDRFVELLVSDNGVGMSEEIKEKIFNPFFTTRDDGTGLGLAIAKKMIHEHGGTIIVDSTKGAGTDIAIRLPFIAQGR